MMENRQSEWKRTTELKIQLQQIIEQAAVIPENDTPASTLDSLLTQIELPDLDIDFLKDSLHS